MGKIRQTDKVKLIAGLIYADEPAASESIQALSARFGPVEMRTDVMTFRSTTYYADEMGPHLRRRFVA